MSRKAVLIAVIFLVSTLGLLVTPVAAQPPMRIYGWGIVTSYYDGLDEVDASGGFFFSVRGDRWMVWLYFRHPYTNELFYFRLDELMGSAIYPDGMVCVGLWDFYVDWVYQGTTPIGFEVKDWRLWSSQTIAYVLYGMVMFSRVRPYYMIT